MSWFLECLRCFAIRNPRTPRSMICWNLFNNRALGDAAHAQSCVDFELFAQTKEDVRREFLARRTHPKPRHLFATVPASPLGGFLGQPQAVCRRPLRSLRRGRPRRPGRHGPALRLGESAFDLAGGARKYLPAGEWPGARPRWCAARNGQERRPARLARTPRFKGQVTADPMHFLTSILVRRNLCWASP